MDFPKEDEGRRIATLSADILELKRTLLNRIEQVEAVLREAEASAEAWEKGEALRREAEAKVSHLESLLEEKENALKSKESTLEELEQRLNAELRDLQSRLAEREVELSKFATTGAPDPEGGDQTDTVQNERIARATELEQQLKEKDNLLEQAQARLNELKERTPSELEQSFKEKELALLARICDLEGRIQGQEVTPWPTGDAMASPNVNNEERATRPPSELQQNDEALRAQALAAEEREERFQATLRELENRLREKDSLLEERQEEITSLQQQAETEAGSVEEERKAGNEMQARIKDLEELLQAKENLLEEHEKIISDLKGQRDSDASALEATLRAREEDLQDRENNMQLLEESLNAEIQELEDRLNDKESLLRSSQAELDDLKEKLAALGASPEGFVTLREEDVVVASAAADGKNKGSEPTRWWEESQGNGESAKDNMEALQTQLRERETMLAAKDVEIKMIKQAMQERVRELESVLQSQRTRKTGKSRLVSFLANLERRQ